MPSPRPLFVALALALAAAGVAGCSSGSDAAATTTQAVAPTTTAPRSATSTTQGSAGTTTPPTTAPPTTTLSTGCTTAAPEVPRSAGVGRVPDVDGDGRPDIGFVDERDGTRRVGILTAAGGGAVTDIDSASPVGLRLLVANLDQRGPVELLVSDNRTVHLLAFVDCTIVPITNPQGRPYEFDLQDLRGNGTGVGCVDTPEGRRLVGLQAHDTATGDAVPWSRTIVQLDGTHARNGATTTGTFTRGRDDAVIDLLHAVSCGDRTMARDGISQPPS